MARLKERIAESKLMDSFAGAVAIYGGAVCVAAVDQREKCQNLQPSFACEADSEEMIDRAYLLAIYGGSHSARW